MPPIDPEALVLTSPGGLLLLAAAAGVTLVLPVAIPNGARVIDWAAGLPAMTTVAAHTRVERGELAAT